MSDKKTILIVDDDETMRHALKRLFEGEGYRVRLAADGTQLSQVLEEGPIEGSWIELKRVPLRKFAFKTEVYYGGVSRIEEDQLMQYEFIADAHTGSILDLYRI